MYGLTNILIPPQYQLAIKVAALVITATVLVGSGYRWGFSTADTRWQVATDKLKMEAATQLQAATDKARKQEELSKQKSQSIEVEYYEALNEIEKLQSIKPVTVVKRLYDPGGRKSCSNAVPKGNSAVLSSRPAETDPSELSGEAERFLQAEALKADIAISECNQFRISSHKWAGDFNSRQNMGQ
jgi:hypothetical protein